MGSDRASIARWAAAGFLLGIALLARGDDRDLEARLRELQELVLRTRTAMTRPELPDPMPESALELDAFAVADLVTGVPQWSLPDLEVEGEESPRFGDLAKVSPPAFGTIEELLERIVGAVAPDSWDTDEAMITAHAFDLLALNRPAVLERVRGFLDSNLRPAAHRSVSIESEIWEIDATAMAPDRDELARDGGRRVFAGRVLALGGQRVLLWHGRQSALVVDTEVEVIGRARVSDPVVRVLFDGGTLFGRVLAGDGPDRVRLDLTCAHEELERPVPSWVTRKAGTVQLPVRDRFRSEATLQLPSGAWAPAALADRGAGRRYLLLVRATLLERGGAAR
jgi:hypothetical protein